MITWTRLDYSNRRDTTVIMKKTTEKFLKLFFNSGEDICFSANQYAYPSESQENLNEESTVLVAINPIKGTRRDDNVTAYRTFMIECDDMDLEEQMKYVKESGFPYSYCCFSGGKSLHFALVLDREIPGESIYRHIYQWILNIMTEADQMTKNPSRCVRFPGVIRPETGKEQKLVTLGDRVSTETLNKWLNKHPLQRPKILEKRARNKNFTPKVKNLKPWAKAALSQGVHNMEGSRNQTWMSLGCEYALEGFDLDDTIHQLGLFFEEQSDFTEREWETAVKSGWNYADKISR